MLSRHLDIGVGRTSACDYGKSQIGRGLENSLRKWGVVRYINTCPLQSPNDFVFRARRFGDFANFTKRYARPRGLIFAKINVCLYFSADCLGKDRRQDEMVAGNEDAGAHGGRSQKFRRRRRKTYRRGRRLRSVVNFVE